MRETEPIKQRDINKEWEEFEEAYKETAKEVLGYRKHGHKPWIKEKSWKLIEERKEIKKEILAAKSERLKSKHKGNYKLKDKQVKYSIREDKRAWVDELADEAEKAAENGKMKTLYSITKTMQ